MADESISTVLSRYYLSLIAIYILSRKTEDLRGAIDLQIIPIHTRNRLKAKVSENVHLK